MKKINISLKLSEELEQIVFDKDERVSLTLKGIFYVNKLVGASIFEPDKIYFDGDYRENPYIINNDDGSIFKVISTSLAVSNYNNNQIVTKATVSFNVDSYLLDSFGHIISEDYTAGEIFKKGTSKLTDDNYVLPINSTLEICVSLKNTEIQRALGQYLFNKNLADRKAQSLSQRNALKKLPQFNCPITNITGSSGYRMAIMTIPYFYDDDKEIKEIINCARTLNANVLNCKLISIDNDEIIDAVDLEYLKSIQNYDEEINKKEYSNERLVLSTKYAECKKKIPEKITKAINILFPDLDLEEVKSLNNKEIKLLIQYAETL